MAEITRVPLKPISRGSLPMLFIGIVIGLLIAAAFAWATAPKGVDVDVVKAGEGAKPGPSDVVFVRYTGKLEDGTVFDQSQDQPLPIPGVLPEGVPLPLAQMVPGFREAVVQMQKGGKYVAHIPSEKAYGAEGRLNPMTGEGVPPDADLTFDIELVDFMTQAEFEQRVRAIQQMMQQMGPQGGAQGEGQGGAQGQAAAPAPATPQPAE